MKVYVYVYVYVRDIMIYVDKDVSVKSICLKHLFKD